MAKEPKPVPANKASEADATAKRITDDAKKKREGFSATTDAALDEIRKNRRKRR